ncbi:MAG: UDP-N-acetylmuramoyl-L-alanine--D-glutamate ligase [Methylococcales bacterium]|nr:UDP-N-acetylmuramoyl-L-alanine--D-glutamate ligase [Methylococcales bacterium]MDD5755006.1 UDP-N-acetylmuramoyl-L-alanine--D-glutamate ligase [Methylococcales bacterium]
MKKILEEKFNLTADSKIVVVGEGITGTSVAKFLETLAFPFLIVDSRKASFTFETFKGATHLIVSPGVSLAEPTIADALKNGAKLVSDIDLFAAIVTAPIVAITGANGKSTVTTMLGDMARTCGKNVGVGGNLGKPALDLLDPAAELYVLELSSFQLERSHVLNAAAATVLNISADHLDRHDDLDNYAQAKQVIFSGDGVMVLNADDERVLAMHDALRKTFTFSIKKPADFYLADNKLMHGEDVLMPLSELPLEGKHNAANALAALALGTAVSLDSALCVKALKNFKALNHRMQKVSTKNSMNWVNDSKATNIGACIAALEGYDEKVILVAGGEGKGQDMNELTPVIQAKAKAVILIGKDAPLIENALNTLPEIIPTYHANDMQEVVAIAAHVGRAGDTVLLSPACASLDQYKNYQDRGNQFALAIEALLV